MSNDKLEQAADKFLESIADLSDEAKAEAEQKFREYMLGKMTKVQVVRAAIASWLFGLADAIADFAERVEGEIPMIEIGAEKIAPTDEGDEETFIL